MMRLTDGSLGNVTKLYLCFVGHLWRAIKAMLVLMCYLCDYEDFGRGRDVHAYPGYS